MHPHPHTPPSGHPQNSCEIPEHVKRQLGVPNGGRWFFKQDPMLQAYADAGGFTVGWDTGTTGKKCYGLYPDAEEFYKSLLLVPANHRCGYELIPESSKCKLYADVEWVGPPEKKHQKLRWILRKLSQHCQERYQRTPEIYVCCSTREIVGDGKLKHSYHIVFPTITFDSNHDGEMKRFFEELCVGDKWHYTDGEKRKCIVDLSVYTKNRCFRPPLCCKKGTSVPFVRISGDPYDLEDFSSSYESSDDPEGWRPFILTNLPTGGDSIQIGPSGPLKKKRSLSGHDSERKIKRARNAAACDSDCPVPLHLIDEMLAQFGDHVSKATNVKPIDGLSGVWQVQCDQKKQTRHCLIDGSKSHSSNNCLIFLKADGVGDLTVEYHCTAEACKRESRALGSLRYDSRCAKWEFTRRAEALEALEPMEEDDGDHDEDNDGDDNGNGDGDDNGNGDGDEDGGDDGDEDGGDDGNHSEKDDGDDGVDDEDDNGGDDGDDDGGEDRDDGGNDDGDDNGGDDGDDGGNDEAPEDKTGEACEKENDNGGRGKGKGKSSKAPRKRGNRKAPVKNRFPDHEANTYGKVKKRFEKQNLKVRNPFVYIRIEKRDGICRPTQFKHAELRQFYIDWHYWEYDNNKEKWVKRRFIDAWLEDPDKREVYTIAVDPQGTQEDVYNMWTGFKASRLTPSDYFKDLEDVEDFVMGPILHHFDHVITGGNREHTEYILDWMANPVQRPWQKTQSLIFLYGKQGCGKGIVFDWYREEVLGPEHTFQTADPDRDLFGRFSDGFVNRAFVQVDEVKSLHDHMDKLKNVVTSDTLTWEQKHGKIVTVKNICNLLFTSNNVNALTIPTDDRRLVLFRCDAKYKGNKQYFQDLSYHLHTPGVSAWFFQILKNRDLSKYPYDFQASRPITEYYKESQQATISQEMRYLSALVNSQVEKVWGGKELYDHYREWAKSEGINPTFIKTNPMFTKEIQTVDGVDVRRSGGIKYRFDKQKIKRSLKESGEYNVNACFHVEKH